MRGACLDTKVCVLEKREETVQRLPKSLCPFWCPLSIENGGTQYQTGVAVIGLRAAFLPYGMILSDIVENAGADSGSL